MSIGGINKLGSVDDVELTSLDPELFPVPDCLTNLNSISPAVSGHFGALDYSRKSVFKFNCSTLYIDIKHHFQKVGDHIFVEDKCMHTQRTATSMNLTSMNGPCPAQ